MQKTLSTLLWIKGREKANEYSGSHTPKDLTIKPHIRGVFCLWDECECSDLGRGCK